MKYMWTVFSSRRAACGAALVLLLVLTGRAAALAGPVLRRCDWDVVRSPNPYAAQGDQNMLNAVVARSPGDVWAVGQVRVFQTDHIKTLAEHWDGARWQIVDTPNSAALTNVLYGVAALGPNDVWAVGYEQPAGFSAPYHTLIEHWNGSTWSIVQKDSYRGVLTSVAAAGPDDVWAVGSTNYPGYGLLEHWDGRSWTYQRLPDAVLLNAVAVIARNDVWAVGEDYRYANGGEQTYTLHFDGVRWTRIPSPNPLKRHLTYAQNWLRAVTGLASNDVWAVGETRDTDWPGGLDDTLTLHWDGTQWSVVGSPDPGGHGNYNSFWAAYEVSPGEVWAGGDFGLDTLAPMIEHWNGLRWGVAQTDGSVTQGAFQAIAADPQGDVWAVGEQAIRQYFLGTLTELCRRRS